MNQEMEESRQPTILGRPRTRPLNPEQELMQSVIDANAPPRIPPVRIPVILFIVIMGTDPVYSKG